MKRGAKYRTEVAALMLLMGIASASAQVRTEQYFTHSMPDNSVVYALPKTFLQAEVIVEEVQETPGELALYARQYLGREDAILAPSKSFRLKGVKLGSYGVPDEERRFSVKFRRNNSATFVSLTPDGLLMGINHAGVQLETPQENKSKSGENQSQKRRLSPMPPEYIQATTTAKKAEIAAEELYRIRDSRTRVVSGESEQPFTDGGALRLAIERLDQAEQQITQYFMGEKSSSEEQHLVQGLDPMAGEGEAVVAFRFSEQEGLLPADDLRGEPIYLAVKVLEQAQQLDDREQKRKERDLSRGVPYVVPGRVLATLTYRGAKIAEQEIPVAQLGALEALDAALFTTKGVRTAISFYPSTGSIAEVQEVN